MIFLMPLLFLILRSQVQNILISGINLFHGLKLFSPESYIFNNCFLTESIDMDKGIFSDLAVFILVDY